MLDANVRGCITLLQTVRLNCFSLSLADLLLISRIRMYVVSEHIIMVTSCTDHIAKERLGVSNELSKYMKGSPLFNSNYMRDGYRRLSDRDIAKALDAYREFSLQRASNEEKGNKPSHEHQNLSIFPSVVE